MITESNKPRTHKLMASLEKHHNGVGPRDGSVMSMIIADGMYPAEVLVRGKTALEAFVEIADKDEDLNPHDQMVEEYAKMLGNGLYKQASNARDIVLPYLNKVWDSTLAATAAAKLPTYQIQQVYLADIHDNAMLFEMLSQYRDIGTEKAYTPYGLPSMEPADIISAVMTGSTVLDDGLTSMIANHADGWVTEVYQKKFAGNVAGELSLPYDVNKMDEMLIMFFLCEHFIKHPPQEIPQMYPDRQNEGVLLALRNQLGRTLINTHILWDEQKTSGQLVITYPISRWIPDCDENAIISVYGETYNSFLDAGGSPEALIGAAVSDSRPYSAKEILDSVQYYCGQYRRYETSADEELAKRFSSIFSSAATTAAAESIGSLPDEVLPDNISREDLIIEMRARLSAITEADLIKAPYRCLRIAICDTIFKETSALEFLCRIDCYMESHEELSARKAAYYVALDMMVAHVVDQLMIE